MPTITSNATTPTIAMFFFDGPVWAACSGLRNAAVGWAGIGCGGVGGGFGAESTGLGGVATLVAVAAGTGMTFVAALARASATSFMVGRSVGSTRMRLISVGSSEPALWGGGTLPDATACSSASGLVFVPNGGLPSIVW